jgi:hypothetical protein
MSSRASLSILDSSCLILERASASSASSPRVRLRTSSSAKANIIPDPPPSDGNRAPGKAHSTRRLRSVYPKASDANNVSRSLLIEMGATLSLDRPLFYEFCRCSAGGMLKPSDANSLSRFLIVRIDTPSILAARVRFPRQNRRVSRIRSRSTSARRRPTNARVASCCGKSSESRWSGCMMQSLRDAHD